MAGKSSFKIHYFVPGWCETFNFINQSMNQALNFMENHFSLQ